MDNFSASQFGGAGFLPNSPATNNAGGVGASPAVKKSGSRTLRALTIKQLYEAQKASSDDMLELDGAAIEEATLVGKILSAQDTNLNKVLVIHDSTGKIEIRYWIEDNAYEQQQLAELQVGVYIRVHGHMRNQQGKDYLQAFKIRPITDFNEVTHHLLSCVFQHLHLSSNRAGAMPPAAAGNYGAAAPVPFGAGGGMGGAPYGGAAAPATDGLNPCQAELQAYFNGDAVKNSDAGASFKDLQNMFGGKYSSKQLQDACSFLMNEGHIYTTVDEEHFKSTELI